MTYSAIDKIDRIELIRNVTKRIPLVISLLATVGLVFDIGFSQPGNFRSIITLIYGGVIITASLSIILRYIFYKNKFRKKVVFIDFIILTGFSFIVAHIFQLLSFNFINYDAWIKVAVLIAIVREFSALKIAFIQDLTPARLFVYSFMLIIIFGTILLMLPKATHNGISFIDALFTATSAVCVTGLIVVDTGSYFTTTGQIIILMLIQAGGLGIMTFTSYFSYFFKGSSSFYNQLALKEMTNAEKVADVFKTLKKIILITFIIEGLGFALIYFNSSMPGQAQGGADAFFAVFHTISAFCNAGFSTLSNSLAEPGFGYNYSLHATIATLFILGGLGFPILFNIYAYFKHLFIHRLIAITKKRPCRYIPWVININTKIIIITTLVLIVSGTVLFYIFEFNNTLAGHHGFGKLITAFFGAVTPRTAGFNTVNTGALTAPALLLVIGLMWIGASPGSTGGGIKTSTFAISLLNILSIARGKKRIEVFRREISPGSVHRASAIVMLSFMVIGVSVFFLTYIEKDKTLLSLIFEAVSAYSTVGLSMGVTGELQDASKMIIILTMFVGRISMLTILIAFLKNVNFAKYRYPTEDILIN